LYVARYPRRRIYGALGVHLDCGTGNFEVEAMSLADLEQSFRNFIELKEEVSGQLSSAG